MHKYYVKFITTGFIAPNESLMETFTTDPDKIAWPKRAICFSIHKQEQMLLQDGTVVKGDFLKLGPTYYHPDCHLETLKQVQARDEDTKTLEWNMEANGWSEVIYDRWNVAPMPYRSETCKILEG